LIDIDCIYSAAASSLCLFKHIGLLDNSMCLCFVHCSRRWEHRSWRNEYRPAWTNITGPVHGGRSEQQNSRTRIQAAECQKT